MFQDSIKRKDHWHFEWNVIKLIHVSTFNKEKEWDKYVRKKELYEKWKKKV